MISKKLENLIKEGLAINLYSHPEMYLKENYWYKKSDIDRLVTEYGNEFLDHLYAIPLKTYNESDAELIYSFLEEQVGEDFVKNNIREKQGEWLHRPNFGIYNSITNNIICFGVGRKNRVFIHCSDPNINDDENKIDTFSSLDYFDLVSEIYGSLTEFADAHSLIVDPYLDDDGEPIIPDGEEDPEETVDWMVTKFSIIYPKGKTEPSDLSPGDF
jgi:hypothetical protein